jgi:hypothetical protein
MGAIAGRMTVASAGTESGAALREAVAALGEDVAPKGEPERST